jgi:putative sigma-54 modulation protein
MNIVIRGHNDHAVEPKIKAYTERKVGRLGRHFDGHLDARVDFTTDGKRLVETQKVVQLTVHVNGHIFKAKEQAPDTHTAIDMAVDKMDRQIVRHKERLQDRKKTSGLGVLSTNKVIAAQAGDADLLEDAG